MSRNKFILLGTIIFVASLSLFFRQSYSYDGSCALTPPEGVNVTLSLYNSTYNLTPSNLNAYQNEIITVSINNYENFTITIDTFFVNISGVADWTHLVLPNCTHGETHLNFSEVGQGLYFFNISSDMYGNTTYIQPVIQVEVTERPLIQSSSDRKLITMNVHDCLNFTEALWNETTQSYTFINVTLCPDFRTCILSDVNEELQTEEMMKLQSALEELLNYQQLRDSMQNDSDPEQITKYYWEVVPEANDYLNELRQMKDCTSQCENVRNDALKDYSVELDKCKTEKIQTQEMYDVCTQDKSKVLSSMVSERKEYTSQISGLSSEVRDCEQQSEVIEENVAIEIRAGEVQPLIYYSVISTLFVLGLSIITQRRKRKPSAVPYGG